MKKFITILYLVIIANALKSQTYLPLSGGTLTGNLNVATGNQLTAPYYGFNSGAPQPATSGALAIFPNNTSQTLDVLGWTNGWRFIPGSSSSYSLPVVTFNVNGSAIFGNTYTGFPGGTSAITIKGPNSPNSSASYQDINYSFAAAGSARIRSYRGGGWDTYLQFLTNNATGDYPTVAMHIDANGSVGIGTTTPNAKLHVESGSVKFPSGSSDYTWFNYNGDNKNYIRGTTILADNGGNILIGKATQTNTQYRLDVAGNIRANQLTVNSTGADFVFEPSYKLKPLKELEFFVIQNHHLPDVEPAEAMQKNGINVGDNQTKLLQKIEELTLYLISQNKIITEQQANIEILKTKVEILEKK